MQGEQGRLERDRKKLLELLKSGRVKVPDYLISNPFSTVTNDDLDGKVTKLLFYSDFFKQSYKHYERIAQILDVAEDIRRNTVFFSGFQGSGKTTFANYVRRLVEREDGEDKLPHMSAHDVSLFNDKELFNSKDLPEFIKTLNSLVGNKVGRDKIDAEIVPFNEKLFNTKRKDIAFIERLTKQINNYIDYLNENLPGKAIYLNFETEVNTSDKPVKQKLNLNLKKRLLDIINEGAHKSVSRVLVDMFKAFGSLALEKEENFYMRDFIKFIENDYFETTKNNNDIQDRLNGLLLKLETDQLLTLIFLQDLAYQEYCKTNKNETYKRTYYIFDNLDVIYDTSILVNFVESYLTFLFNVPSLLRKEKVVTVMNEIFKKECSFHSDFCFIFIMRETSQMHIADHLWDRLNEISVFFDISSDVNKSDIPNIKMSFIEKNNKDKSLDHFLTDTNIINTILADKYVKNSLSVMFNNDYKKMIKCLSFICESSREQIDEYMNICRLDSVIKPSMTYGTRGILFRLIFNHFKSQGYYKRIKIVEEKKHQINYSPARLVLLYLNSIQYYPIEKPSNNQEDRIPLSELFNALEKVLFKKEPSEEFSDALAGMFNLRSTNWSHLITFDSVKERISSGDIQNIIKHRKSDVNIRITCAGRNFIRFMTSHFEFYACRFFDNSNPLFSSANEKFDKATNRYEFENVLEAVCAKMEDFCENMNLFIEKLLEKTPMVLPDEIELVDFLYVNKDQENKEREYILFHEERYIHQHITYIDAYRMYLINANCGKFTGGDIIDINKRILPILKRYIDLLIKYGYYSLRSKKLHEELNECVKYIVDTKNYNCNEIEISSPSYNSLKKGNLIVNVND